MPNRTFADYKRDFKPFLTAPSREYGFIKITKNANTSLGRYVKKAGFTKQTALPLVGATNYAVVVRDPVERFWSGLLEAWKESKHRAEWAKRPFDDVVVDIVSREFWPPYDPHLVPQVAFTRPVPVADLWLIPFDRLDKLERWVTKVAGATPSIDIPHLNNSRAQWAEVVKSYSPSHLHHVHEQIRLMYAEDQALYERASYAR